MMDFYEEFNALAMAIVTQAATDYFSALYWLKHNKPSNTKEYLDNVKTKIDCEMFFRSGWCKQLTEIDGEKIIKVIRGRVKRKR